MNALDRFSSVVATLYEAAAEPEHWPRFLAELASALSGTHGYLTAVGVEPPPESFLVLQGYSEQEITSYRDHYQSVDLVLHTGLAEVEKRGRWIGVSEDILPMAELEKSEVYNDYIRPAGLGRQAGIGFGRGAAHSFIGLAVWRPLGCEEYGANELHLLHLLAPHVKQALALHARMASLQETSRIFQAGVEASLSALLALDSSARVIASSESARRLLETSDGIVLEKGKLRALDGTVNRRLQQLLQSGIEAGDMRIDALREGETPPGGAVLIPRTLPARPLQLLVTPFHSHNSLAGLRPKALVFISDPSAGRPYRTDILRDLYGLSPTQCRVAELLLAGEELKTAAAQLGLSYDAARFHLREVFRKTQTGRQSELLCLLQSAPGIRPIC